jgi:hypothetical protein
MMRVDDTRKTRNGQLRPVTDRLTANRMERRTLKITKHQLTTMAKEVAITRGMVMGVVQMLRRPFTQRIKWLLRGK